MKKCTKCLIEKPETEFFFQSSAKKRLHAECKACYRAHRKSYQKEHYAKYKEFYLFRAQLSNKKLREQFHQRMRAYMLDKFCEYCGECDPIVLEFDHINPETKSFNISQAARFGKDWGIVLAEMEKCQILCANCHKRRTAQQFHWYKAK